ncbi:MAG: thioredoxin [Bacteroidales bacterium]|jgi:thioredoxin 1|nr:thioredoxin [Bacteroidales bacterium]
MAAEINDSSFDEKVLNSEQPVMVDFWAEWCGPCRMIAPVIEEISNEYAGRALVLKCNVDNCPEMATKYGIRNIPAVFYFKGGQVVDRQIGAASKSAYTAKLDALL